MLFANWNIGEIQKKFWIKVQFAEISKIQLIGIIQSMQGIIQGKLDSERK